MKKKLFLLLLSLLPLLAQGQTDINGIWYELNSSTKTAEVRQSPYYYEYYSGKVNIPQTVANEGITYSVTSIGDGAFEGCRRLTSVTIPNSVTSIGNSAFKYCSGLTSVTIPNSVTSIDDYAFDDCSGLTSVTIGNSVTSIGNWAFRDCSGLTSVTIGNSVTSIGDFAFDGCSGLTSVTIPNSVTSIGKYAFDGCSGLTSVTINSNDIVSANRTENNNYLNNIFGRQVKKYVIGDDVTSIGKYTFEGCSGLTSVIIPNSVTYIGLGAFYNCSGLTSVSINCDAIVSANRTENNNYLNNIFGSQVKEYVIGDDVTSIGKYAFNGYSGLTSVTIPNSVTSIGDGAFRGCSSLTSVTIPNSVTSIGDGAFSGCSGLTSVEVESGNTVYDSRNNCNAIITSFSNTLICGCKNTVIPESVTSIGNYAFYGCSGLTSVNIPNSVTSIGSYAFQNCSGLTSVTIPNSVTSIGNDAFRGCSSLTSITIPNSVTSIGSSAFYGCKGLTSSTIGNSVTSIGERAFAGCSGLTCVHISDLAAWCNISFGDYGNPLSSAHHLYLNGTEVTDLVIPNSVTSIGYSAFYGCSGLTSVTIPNSVTSIGSYAFYNCSGLTSVTIPNSVTSIRRYAFSGCSGLTSVTINSNDIVSADRTENNNYLNNIFGSQVKEYIIGDDVTSIGNDAFRGCSGLTTVTIPNSVTSIGNDAFRGCSSLTSVTIPNSVTSIGVHAFNECSGLTSVKVESGNTVYDSRNNCNAIIETASGKLIQGCMSTVIPNDVTSIGNDAFYGCSGLTSVNIPNSVTSIGDYAFYGCNGLQEVFCLAASVPSTSSDAFKNASLSSAHLFVLHQSIETYRNNSPWSGFGTISAVDVQQNGFYYIFDTPKEEATVTGAANSLSGNLNIPSYVVYEGVDYDVVAIYDNAFQNCSNITSINIPNIVTSIGNKAFEGCSGLTSLSIGKKIKSIGQNAFKGCSGLNSITVASGNTVYDSRNDCNAIIETASGKLIQGCNSTVIPVDVTSIGDAAFYNCSGLTAVNIGNSVTSIGDSAFNGCSGLTAVNIPQGVESIGDAAFIGCSRLTSVTLNSNSIVSADRTENDNLNGIFGSQVKEYVLGDDVTAIGQNAFRGNTKLATITIGNGVTAIGNAAFNGCTGLTSVSINSDAIVSANRTENDNLNSIFGSQVKEYVVGDDVTAIGDYAFQGNTNLSMITLGNSVTSIGASAFYNCRITSTTIPSSVTAIGENAFYGCSRLNSTTISDLEAWCNISFGNQYSNPLYQTHHLYLNGTEVKALDIPTSVNAIGNYAFYGCSGLTSVNIPESVTSIGIQAFNGCSGLTSVTIPNSVTSIGNQAFYGCSGLTSVNIPESVTSIGIQAFNGCNGLTSVTINNHNIVSADRTENDNLNNIFGNQVKEYIVEEDVTAIGQNAFRGNTNLTTVSVGKNIGSIGDNAFYGCSNLATFTCYAADIPTANSSVFEGIDLTTATLYVPASALEEYEETKPWRRFGTILPIDENAVPTAIDTAAADDYKEYFDLSGHRVKSTQRGLLIVRDRSGKTRKVMVK